VIEVEINVMQLFVYTEDWNQPPEARKEGWRRFSLRASRKKF
jgi:hypothetical protein